MEKKNCLQSELNKVSEDWLENKIAVNTADVIRRCAELYRVLGGGNNLLDIGCGYGFTDIYLSYFYNTVHGLEVSEKNYNIARHNSSKNNNIKIFFEDARHFKSDIKYDSVLFETTLNVLESKNMFYEMFDNISTLLSNNAKILFVAINDIELKEQYINRLPLILKAKGFAENKIFEIVERNKNTKGTAYWHKIDFQNYFQKFDAKIKYFPSSYKDNPSYEVTFDMLVEIKKWD